MAEPWTYKDGIYTLNNDDPKILKSQRKDLIEHINELSRKKGRSTEFFKEAIINGESLRLGQKDKFKKGIANLVFRSNTGSRAAAAKKLANMTQPNQKVLDWMFNLNIVGWPKGKSPEGFVKWAIDNYNDVKKLGKLEELIDGIARDAGHAQSGGFSSKTGLAPQYRQHPTMGNQSLKGVLKKFKHLVKSATQDVRTKADLFEADVSFTPEQSFFDYMNEGPEGQAFRRGSPKHTWFTQEGWTPEQRMAVLFDRDFAPTADSGRLKVLQEQLNAAGRQDLARAVRGSMNTNKAILSRIDAKGIYQAPTIKEGLEKATSAATKNQIPLAIERAGKTAWANTQEILNSWKLNGLVKEASKVGKGVKLPGYVLPGLIGTTLAGLDLDQKRADAQENPTLANKVQLGLASANTTLEGADLATGGVSGAFTLPFQILMDVFDRSINYIESGGRKRGDAGMSMFGGGIPGTESYKRYTKFGLDNSPSYVARPQPSQKPVEEPITSLELDML